MYDIPTFLSHQLIWIIKKASSGTMNIKIIFTIGLILLVTLSFTGCNDEPLDESEETKENITNNDDTDQEQDQPYQSYSSRLFGSWNSESEHNNTTTIISYTFNPNFTFSTYYLFEEVNRTGTGTWFVYDSSLSMTLSVVNETAVFDIEFLDNDNTLRLTDEQQNVITLNKKSM